MNSPQDLFTFKYSQSPSTKGLKTSQSFFSTRDFSAVRSSSPSKYFELKDNRMKVNRERFQNLDVSQIKRKLDELQKELPTFKKSFAFKKRTTKELKNFRFSRFQRLESLERMESVYVEKDKKIRIKIFRNKSSGKFNNGNDGVIRLKRSLNQVHSVSRKLLNRLRDEIFGESSLRSPDKRLDNISEKNEID